MANHPVFGNVTNISRNFVEKNDAKRRNRNPRLKVAQGTNLVTQGNLPDDKTERVDGAENVVSVNPNLKCPLCEVNHWLPVAICLKESLMKKDTSLCAKRVYVTIVFNQVTWLVLAQSRVSVKFLTAS